MIKHIWTSTREQTQATQMYIFAIYFTSTMANSTQSLRTVSVSNLVTTLSKMTKYQSVNMFKLHSTACSKTHRSQTMALLPLESAYIY